MDIGNCRSESPRPTTTGHDSPGDIGAETSCKNTVGRGDSRLISKSRSKRGVKKPVYNYYCLIYTLVLINRHRSRNIHGYKYVQRSILQYPRRDVLCVLLCRLTFTYYTCLLNDPQNIGDWKHFVAQGTLRSVFFLMMVHFLALSVHPRRMIWTFGASLYFSQVRFVFCICLNDGEDDGGVKGAGSYGRLAMVLTVLQHDILYSSLSPSPNEKVNLLFYGKINPHGAALILDL